MSNMRANASSIGKVKAGNQEEVTAELAAILGARRTALLRRIVRQTGLPPEVLLDLALEMLDLASRKLAPPPEKRQAVGLGTARWRNVSPEDRSRILQAAAQARWAGHEKAGRKKVRSEG